MYFYSKMESFWKVFWKASCLREKLVVQIWMRNPQVFRSIRRGTRYGANTSWCRRLDLRLQQPLPRPDYLSFALSVLVVLFTQMGWYIWDSVRVVQELCSVWFHSEAREIKAFVSGLEDDLLLLPGMYCHSWSFELSWYSSADAAI